MIRTERPGDEAAIAAVTTAAFAGAEYSSGTEAAIVAGLRRAGALTISLVMEESGTVAGHAAFSPVTIGGEEGDWYGLGPVSVLPAKQGGGIGAALIREGLARLEALCATGCVVLGDPAYYGRFGFASDERLRYRDLPPEYFQRLVFSGADPLGSVEYHPAFDIEQP